MVNKDEKEKRQYTIEDLENLLDNIPYIIWIKDEEGRYKYANKLATEKLDLEQKNLLGKKNSDFKDNEILKNWPDNERKILEEKSCAYFKRKIKSDGEDICVETYNMPFLSSKKTNLIGGVVRKITTEKKVVSHIKDASINICNKNKYDELKNKERLKQIISDFKKIIGAQGMSVYIYNSEKEIFENYVKSGVMNKSNEVISKDDINNTPVNKFYCIRCERELVGVLNVQYREEDIHKYNNEDFIKSICDVIGIIINNKFLYSTLNKELNKRVESEKELELFLETATDLCGIAKNDGSFIKVTNNWTKVLGWSKEELMNMNCTDLIHKDDLPRIYELLNLAYNYNKWKYVGFIDRCICKNGEYRTLEWNWSYINGGKTFIMTGKDITNYNKLALENKRLQNAIALESLKTQFFANLSHEFKTPLNIILTTAQLMESYIKKFDDILEKQNMCKYIKGLKQNSYRLLKLVNNLIDITKIDGGHYKVNMVNKNIVNVIEEIVLSVAEYTKNKERDIIFDTDEEEIILACDPEKIERIILNLVSNALKYTEKDGIIKVNISTNLDDNEVIISVKDNGIGIPKEYKEKIFERFKQVENSLHKNYEGSGIGLSLVKSIVEMHGGEIWINSNPEEGTEVIFTLPIRKIDEEKLDEYNNKKISSKIEVFDIEFSDIYSM
ncbi:MULTISPECIES: ATP-binding protein [Clostridium]|uniref:histidine kinase n=4 Tax=Clostridium TaxID=1485 RepID=A0ABU1EKT1_9CLOT|nr:MULTISPECIES: ATP-binding protein [unclassified Clostridium]MDR5588914.1 ATP-binding protein [Clostridium sp. 5N-1]NFG63420.1 PAS domain S-box protein [Clostridium botulinum]NFQ11094.1 PAS domain S-box protein [Clostridium botulinum]